MPRVCRSKKLIIVSLIVKSKLHLIIKTSMNEAKNLLHILEFLLIREMDSISFKFDDQHDIH